MTPTTHHSRLDLTSAPDAVPEVRHRARDLLRSWGVAGDVLFDALVIVTELATNAVLHAAGSRPRDEQEQEQRSGPNTDCVVDLRVRDDRLYMAVCDRSRQVPVLQSPSDETENSRGLHVVASLTGGAWGFVYTACPPGKLVWACLLLPPSGVESLAGVGDENAGLRQTRNPLPLAPSDGFAEVGA